MRFILLSLALLVLSQFGTGCSLVGCDRVFPHATWYWSSEAERCRASHKLDEQRTKEYQKQQALEQELKDNQQSADAVLRLRKQLYGTP
jgi:hypothetical protein